jgi:SAM-dependent methyltransferase
MILWRSLLARAQLERIAFSNAFSLPAPDSYLTDIASRFPSHSFLGGAAQLMYQRTISTFIRQAETLGSQKEGAWLDWGCGKGHISYLLLKDGISPICCDVTVDAEDSAFGQKTPILDEISAKLVPLEDEIILPFDDISMDVIFSIGVLEHVKDDKGSLKEVLRILKPGGLFMVSMLPSFWSPGQRLAHAKGNFYHDRLYRRYSTFQMVRQAGFQVLYARKEQIFPKNSVPRFRFVEILDFLLCRTPIGMLSTNHSLILRKPLG